MTSYRRGLPDRANDASNALVIAPVILPADIDFICNSLSKNSLFDGFLHSLKLELIQGMQHYSLAANEIVYTQNSQGETFFVVKSGELEITVNSKRVKGLSVGESFGESVLISETPRTSTVRALRNSTLWGLKKSFFQQLATTPPVKAPDNSLFLSSIPIFSHLSKDQLNSTANSLVLEEFTDGEFIVKQGEKGAHLYIIKTGTATCTQDGKFIRGMGEGEFFGEHALLFSSPRTASVAAEGDVQCLTITKEILNSVFGTHFLKIIYTHNIVSALENDGILGKLANEQTTAIAAAVKIVTYRKKGIVIGKGTRNRGKIWILVYGGMCSGDREIRVREIIGTETEGEVYTEDIIATEDSDLAEISKEKLEEILGGSLLSVLTNSDALGAFQKVQLFKDLPADSLRKLTNSLSIQKYSDGETIVVQGEHSDSFFLIKSGIVNVTKDGISKRHLMKDDYFGERSILFIEGKTATAAALGEVVCWRLSRHHFLESIDREILAQMTRRIRLQDDTIELTDLLFTRSISKSEKSSIFLVSDRTSKELYVLKTYNKQIVIPLNLCNRLKRERKILLEIDHDFIVKLLKTFKDNERLYFLMEYVPGKSLYKLLREQRLIPEETVQFYAACLLEIIHHLHERGIIHRDLKLEHFVIDPEGYPKLIDVSSAKDTPGRSHTVVGTPHYTSPEVALGKQHSKSSDFWSLGVIIYELLYGHLPFGDDQVSPYEIYNIIIRRRLKFYSFIQISALAKDAISLLLEKDPLVRLQSTAKNHEWFGDFEWKSLWNRTLKLKLASRCAANFMELEKAQNSILSIEECVRREESTHAQDCSLEWDLDF